MKDWIKSHRKVIIVIALCVFIYIILNTICSDYIHFYEDDDEFNIKVAKFYFITLPIASVLPVILYKVITYIKKEKTKEENIENITQVPISYDLSAAHKKHLIVKAMLDSADKYDLDPNQTSKEEYISHVKSYISFVRNAYKLLRTDIQNLQEEK